MAQAPSTLEERIDRAGQRGINIVFGDRIGLTIFLVAVLFSAFSWRIGILINDSNTVANALVAVADGHLDIRTAAYGPDSGVNPGTIVVDQRLYGRNYGHVVLAAPLLWALRGIAAVADVSLVIVSGWCLVVLAVATLTSQLRGNQTIFSVGVIGALAAFLANLWVARPLPTQDLPIVALQLVTMGVVAYTAVSTYRLFTRMYTTRIGAGAGLGVVFATPIGFWATIPKRHSFVALAAVLTIYCFYRSRAADTITSATRFRALTYVWIGLLAWVNAAEAFMLFLAVGPLDLLTARSNHPRQLLLPGLAFSISLLPFLITNTFISGSPLTPPNLLPTYRGVADVPALIGNAPSNGTPSGETTALPPDPALSPESPGGTGDATPLGPVTGVLGSITRIGSEYTTRFLDSARLWTAAPDRIVDVFLRGGYLNLSPPSTDRAHGLSVLESMPLLAALVGIPIAIFHRLRKEDATLRIGFTPERATDLLVIAYAVLVTHFYLRGLPLHVMYTMRYLHPVYILGLYGVIRFQPLRELIDFRCRTLVASYVGTVSIGLPAYIGGLATLTTTISESVQLYAVIAFLLAACVGLWAIIAAVSDVDPRVGAVLIGTATGAVTVYLLVSSLSFFAYTEQFALPISRALADQLRFINPARSTLWLVPFSI